MCFLLYNVKYCKISPSVIYFRQMAFGIILDFIFSVWGLYMCPFLLCSLLCVKAQ